MVHPGAFGSPEPDVPLDTSWPGLDPDRTQVQVDPDELERLAELLLAECDSIRDEYGDGSLKHFSQTAGKPMVTKEGRNPFGEWSSGAGLRELHSEVYDYTHKFYNQLVQQLDAAAQALRSAAERYRQGEDDTLAAIPPAPSGMVAAHVTTSGPASYPSSGGSGGSGGAQQSGQTTDFEGLDG